MKGKKLTDLQLVRQFTKGSLAAFEELTSRHHARVFNMALKFTRNREDAEEVLQDVFVTLYKKLPGFEGKSQFSSWLYRIVVNAAFMKLRKRRQTPATSLEDLSPAVRQLVLDFPANAPERRSDNIATANELRKELEQAVERLPEQYRAVFILRDVDGMTNQEVGDILELSIPAVKSRLHRSRLMLRRKLLKTFREYVGREPILDEAESDLAVGE